MQNGVTLAEKTRADARLARPFTGIIAAPVLPMLESGAVDWSGLGRYMRWIAAQRPAAIAMNMDASEGPSLTTDEMIEVIRVGREAIDGACPLLSGLIAGSTDGAIALGRKLNDAGAAGVVVFPPFPTFLGQPTSEAMVVRFHADIAEGLGLPMIAFQFPKGWGPDYSEALLRDVAAIPQLIALKESSFDTQQTTLTIERAAALPAPVGILTGSDTFIYEAMLLGCDGALIGFAATATHELVAMHAAVAAGDYAGGKAIWDRLGPLARYCWRPPIRDYRARMKEVLLAQGKITSAAVRRPLLPVDAAERAEIRRLVAQAGLN
jgi:4-hydroxy-tetrahydrodipicolinate synthase